MTVSPRIMLLAAAFALVAALCLFSTKRAAADTFTISFPTGLVCEDAALSVTVSDNSRLVTRTFTSRDGTVRSLTAGTGSDLVFFNPNHPSVTYALKGNGAVARSTTTAGGTTTVTLTGHNIIFYFPTDTLLGGTPGPATFLVTGSEVFSVDAAQNSTQLSESGNITDICAQLPPD